MFQAYFFLNDFTIILYSVFFSLYIQSHLHNRVGLVDRVMALPLQNGKSVREVGSQAQALVPGTGCLCVFVFVYLCACVLVYLFYCVCPMNQLSPTSTHLKLISYNFFISVYFYIFEYLCTFKCVLFLFVSQVTSDKELAPT